MNADLERQLLRRITELERRLGIQETVELSSAHSHTGYVNTDGSSPLSGEWDIGEDMSIRAERIEARDAEGLILQDDGGNRGLTVLDGGLVQINRSTINVVYQSMTNDQVLALSTWTPITDGILFLVNSTSGRFAIYAVQGGYNSTAEMAGDVTNEFSPTKNTASSLNIYYESGYQIQNKMGGPINVGLLALG